MQGASRTIGGILRGHAHGNVLNIADITMEKRAGKAKQAMGKARIFSAESVKACDPATMPMDYAIEIPVSDDFQETLQVIVTKLSQPRPGKLL